MEMLSRISCAVLSCRYMALVARLHEPTEKDLVSVNALLKQLRSDPSSHKPITLEHLRQVVSDPNTAVLVARDGEEIVGIATVIWDTILTGSFALIEDVVVDERCRGQGLGRLLTEALIDVARKQGIHAVALTSRPSRVAANALYQKLGFQLKETNYYELKL